MGMMSRYMPRDHSYPSSMPEPPEPIVHCPPPEPSSFFDDLDEGVGGPLKSMRSGRLPSNWEAVDEEVKGDSGNNHAEAGNFFDQYRDGDGIDDIAGHWVPGAQPATCGDALPGSWERPLCVECGQDEGEEGGGRYGHDDHIDQFYCGRCWKSWDEEEQRKMMSGYAPRRHIVLAGAPEPLDPMVDSELPEPTYFDEYLNELEGNDDPNFRGRLLGSEREWEAVDEDNSEDEGARVSSSHTDGLS